MMSLRLSPMPVTYVLPGRSGLTHRDSEGCKMRYGDGAVQWMTAGRGMLHEVPLAGLSNCAAAARQSNCCAAR